MLSSPHMSEEGYELGFVQDAFQKNWIAPLGENVTEFERAVCDYTGIDYAVALSSGTAALHLALIVAGVCKGDRVFCQDLTFAASANPICYLGAEPVFIDSEEETWNMDPEALQRAIDLYGVPRAVIVVYLYGNPAKMAEITEICRKHGILLIEDAAEALGSLCRGEKCGNLGDIGILSFNGNKIITTSGGGMMLCKDKNHAEHALKLATQAREPFPWYEHTEVGYNYRLSNISAGIGRGQMMVLDRRVTQKRAIYERYRLGLAGLPVELQPLREGDVSNCWLTSIVLKDGCGVSPDDVLSKLNENGMEGRHLWKPMHLQPVFRDAAFVTVGERAVSESLFARGVCLPSDSKMTMEDVDRVCSVLKELF